MEEVKTDYEQRLKETFQGRIVRKDLTKKIKEGECARICVGISAGTVLQQR